MKFKLLKVAITGFTLCVGGCLNLAHATSIRLFDIGNLTADFSQANTGNFTNIPGGGNGGKTFDFADFGTLNGTASTMDASMDSVTFKLSVTDLIAFSGTNNQTFMESGATTNGIGIFYQANNLITFASRYNGGLINKVSLDASSLINQSFDIVASLSLESNYMNLFVGDLLSDQVALITPFLDWTGTNDGGFGKTSGNSNVMGVTGNNFTSGTLSNFNFYNSVVVQIPEPAPIALLGLSLVLVGYRRRQIKSA